MNAGHRLGRAMRPGDPVEKFRRFVPDIACIPANGIRSILRWRTDC
jgi:hypothetical protein